MASAKMGAKSKIKEERGKICGSQDEPDAALLRKPIQTSITGFAQARKIFDSATEELKGLLTTECDLLYECKVCRNLFRSLANFIAHKRVYCKETFNSSIHGHFIKPLTIMSEMTKIKHVEEGYQDYLRNKEQLCPEAPRDRVPLSKDVTAVLEHLMRNGEATAPADRADGLEVAVQKIPTSGVAVFQNLVKQGDDADDMCSEVTEIDNFMAKDSAVLKEDGKFETCAEQEIIDKETTNKDSDMDKEGTIDKEEKAEDDNVIHISDDDDSSQLVCKICDIKFSTRKTHRFHMKYKHVADRLVYPCTDCCDVFSTSWSVLRHLYRVHRKTLTQIRRMREVVQSRAFRMDNMPMSYVKKKNSREKVSAEEKLTEDERIDQENQAWMDNMESDSELPRCGGCGRSFERRAALAAHTYTCQSRTRALARKPGDRPPVRREVRPAKSEGDVSKPADKEETKNEESESKKPESEETKKEDEAEEMEVEVEEPNQEQEDESDAVAAIANPNEEIERGNMEALRKKMADYLDKSGGCRLCCRKYTTPSHLCRHMATHFNWRRFGCKLCNYVNYDRNRLVQHSQTIHKLRGSEEFHASIIRMVSAEEALTQSKTPSLSENEWSPSEESEEEDEPRSDPPALSRRKQTFRTSSVKSKSASPAKDDDKLEKPGTKRPLNAADKTLDAAAEELEKNRKKKEESSSDSGRPVRKRMRPKKDEDFEYDFSNMMRWEANNPASRTITNKRKSTAENSSNETSPDKTEDRKNIKLDVKKAYAGALSTMSDRAVAQSRALSKPLHLPFQMEKTSAKASELTQLFRRKLTNVVDATRRNSAPTSDEQGDKSLGEDKQEEAKRVFGPVNYRPLLPVKNNPNKSASNSKMVVVKTVLIDKDCKANPGKYIQKIVQKVQKPPTEKVDSEDVQSKLDKASSEESKDVPENGDVSLSEKVVAPECIELS